METWFQNVEVAPPIEVFSLVQKFREDPHPTKVNLSVGAYRTDDGQPWVLPVVRDVEREMANDETLNHEYLPVTGLPDFCDASTKLLLGSDNPVISQNRAGGVQAIGGTGALRIGMDFLHSRLGFNNIYVSNPTWGNHKGIAKALGYTTIGEYRQWDEGTKSFDCDGMIADLKSFPDRSVIMLHMVAHNPTGMDPTSDQWERIADAMQEKHHFAFFDCAYQGFATGDLDADAYAIRYFVNRGFEVFGAQSYSKNFGLYNERVGNLTFVVQNATQLAAVKSQLQLVVRTTWSNSSAHGCRVVARVLNNPSNNTRWQDHVKVMASRIILMRDELKKRLIALGTPGNWDHITKQQGMFSYTGLNAQQCEKLITEYHIYLLKSGRINMCGLTSGNLDYVANAINAVVVGSS